MGLKVISPVTITDSVLVSSTVPEPDTGEVAWAIGTTYALNDVVYKNHKLYESQFDGANVGNNPEDDIQNDPDNPPQYWLDLRKYTNRWNMFDNIRNSQTIGESPLEVVFNPVRAIDSLAMFGLFADSVEVEAKLGTEVVYTYTENLNYRNPTTFLEWGTLPFKYKENIAIYDIPPLLGLEVKITLTSTTDVCKCGATVIGLHTELGNIMYGAKIRAYNYSRIEEQLDGSLLLTQRPSVPEPELVVAVEKENVNKLLDLRDELNAKPTSWIGLDQVDDPYYRAVLMLGVYTQFEIDLAHFSHAILTLKVREMT